MMLIKTLTVLLAANASAAQQQQQENPTAVMLKMGFMIVMFVVLFYFIGIRPQSKKAKEHAALLKTLRSGDRITTNGGLVGVVLNVKDKSVSIRSGDSKLEIQKGAISEVVERSSEAS